MADQDLLKEALRNALEVFKGQCRDDYMVEENVKIKLVLPIIEKLGWDIIKDIDFEFTIDHPKIIDMDLRHMRVKPVRVDCCFMKEGKPILFLDVKAYKKKSMIDHESESQLKIYCISKNISCGIITDGIRWNLYGPYGNEEVDDDFQKELFFSDGVCNNDIIKTFAKFYPENIDYLRDNDMYFLDKIWNDEICHDNVIKKEKDEDVIVKKLSERIKYEIISKASNVKIKDNTIEKFVKLKVSPVRSVGVKGSIYEIFKKNIGFNIDKRDVNVIRDSVVSFWRMIGWEECNKEGNFIILKKESNPIFITMIKEKNSRSNHNKEILKGICKKYKVRYGIITNGIKWNFYDFYEREYDSCWFNEVNLKNDKIEHVVAFLSMFSKDKIGDLHKNVVCSRMLGYIWEEKREDCPGKFDENKNIDIWVKKYHDKILAMKPDLEISDDYLKKEIERIILNGSAVSKGAIHKKEKKKSKFSGQTGSLYVKYNHEEIRGNDSTDVFVETLKRIGLDKVAQSGVVNCKVPVVSKENYPNEVCRTYNKKGSKIKQVNGYYILAQGRPSRLADIIEYIKESDNLKDELVNLFVDIR